MPDPEATCSGPDCSEPPRKRGLCIFHYQQQRAGRELTPRDVGRSTAHYKRGERVFHGERPCTFVVRASARYLMFAALMEQELGRAPTEILADIDRYVGGGKRFAFVTYDDGSIGVLRPRSLSRKPKKRAVPPNPGL